MVGLAPKMYFSKFGNYAAATPLLITHATSEPCVTRPQALLLLIARDRALHVRPAFYQSTNPLWTALQVFAAIYCTFVLLALLNTLVVALVAFGPIAPRHQPVWHIVCEVATTCAAFLLLVTLVATQMAYTVNFYGNYLKFCQGPLKGSVANGEMESRAQRLKDKRKLLVGTVGLNLCCICFILPSLAMQAFWSASIVIVEPEDFFENWGHQWMGRVNKWRRVAQTVAAFFVDVNGAACVVLHVTFTDTYSKPINKSLLRLRALAMRPWMAGSCANQTAAVVSKWGWQDRVNVL